MNCFEMAWRSLWRKPIKSILLLLVVCTISVFLLAGISSKDANITTQDQTRQAIGAGLLLEGNEANRHLRLDEISKQIGENEGSLQGVHQKKIENSGGIAWQIWTDNSFETLRIEDIEKIASLSGISDYNITTSTFAVNPINFTRIEDEDNDQSMDVQGVALIGNRDMTMDASVLSGGITLTMGEWITSDNVDTCIVSQDLADKNHLKIGDTLQFNDYHDRENSTIYGAKVIGIYERIQEMTPFMSGDTYRSENVIYTDLRFPEKAEGSKENPLFEKAYFKVDNVDDYDHVKEAVKELDIDWQRYDLIDNNGMLETMSMNFNNLASMSELLIYVVAGVSFVILSFVFIFWLRSRIQEIGILLALGFSKGRIIKQILLEACIVSIVGVLLSFTITPAVSKMSASYLVDQQVQQKEEQTALDSGKIATQYQESKQEVTGVIVSISPTMLIMDGMGVLILVCLSIASASILILRKKPRDIVSEMS